MIEPLDWPRIVGEAVRRRKAEGLTQRDLAALAEVSAPTVIAFERGDTTLKLENALALLRVLGLAADAGADGGQNRFVSDCELRWAELVSSLPHDAPARHPLGFVRYDYELSSPDLQRTAPRALLSALEGAVVRKTGWPPFFIPKREGSKPEIIDGVVECWLGRPGAERAFPDAAHTDFWRASPEGRLFLQRGLQEDGPDIHEPGVILDLTMPIWRAAEVLLHAASLAGHLSDGETEPKIRARVRYAGLAGRELLSWAKPLRHVMPPGRHRARVGEAQCLIETSPAAIAENLAGEVERWIAPLYQRFDYRLAAELVSDEVADLLARDVDDPRRSRRR